MKRLVLIFLVCFTMPTHPRAYADPAVSGLVDVLVDGKYVKFTEQVALAMAVEAARFGKDSSFSQAVGHALQTPSMAYRQIWQNRQGNSTIDAAIEREELRR